MLLGSALLSGPALTDIPSASGECKPGIVETTPSRAFTAIESGAVVRHVSTGLEWRRCSEGLSWNGSTCSGTAQTFTWQAALIHADNQTGWRLPNINELRSIVERCKFPSAINQFVFPDIPVHINQAHHYWSSSDHSVASPSLSAWYVSFYVGEDRLLSKTLATRIRLVRDGE